MKLTFELVEWVKQILPSLRWVGFIQSGEDLNTAKRTKRLKERALLSAWLPEFEYSFFFPLPCLQTWTEALISAQPGFRLEPHHQFSGTLACWLQILRLNSFHNCSCHFLIILINIFVYINRNEYLYTSRYKNLYILICKQKQQDVCVSIHIALVLFIYIHMYIYRVK